MRQTRRKRRLRKRDIWTIMQLKKRRAKKAKSNQIKRWYRKKETI
jgi:hypothetical protein